MFDSKNLMEKIISLSKQRGFIFQASEIYGGIAGFWDYGPLGVELVNNLKQLWWRKVVHENSNIFGIDGSIIQSPKLWEASGHIAGFTDPLVDCQNCGARHRADHLAKTDSTDIAELTTLLIDAECPNCKEKKLTAPRKYNMMMKTWIGPIEDDSAIAYLRPETAGPMFTNFSNVQKSMRAKLPFGIAQIGKAFRNEISPRDFIFRVRELEQMEMQYFVEPGTEDKSYERWRKFAWSFLTSELGLEEGKLQWHEHEENERAHYAAAAHDIYFKFPQGFKELWGTHNRTDYDLKKHTQYSDESLTYFNEEKKESVTPYVVESSVGVGRMLLAVLTNAYKEDTLGGEKRVYLALKPSIAPVKACVSPLLKNKEELVNKAKEVYDMLKRDVPQIMWDDNGNIGKRYRRQDEIGTPFCVTVDFDTLGEKPELKDTVTLRERDSGVQQRLSIEDAILFIKNKTHE